LRASGPNAAAPPQERLRGTQARIQRTTTVTAPLSTTAGNFVVSMCKISPKSAWPVDGRVFWCTDHWLVRSTLMVSIAKSSSLEMYSVSSEACASAISAAPTSRNLETS
jgi:hypothetical protein